MINEPSYIKCRMNALSEALTTAARFYYSGGGGVSDVTYDELMQDLLQLEEEHPQLVEPDSPTKRLGSQVIDPTPTPPLKGNTYVIAGTMNGCLLNDLRDEIRHLGGSVVTNVTTKITALIIGNNPKEAYTEALSKGVKVIHLNEYNLTTTALLGILK